ncbi:hypothetical protein NIES4074_37420 [Cylindrospermum sp. NIES-4074]|nr:hypothetical protein NIES4074_37420 [Cylindrospermum sp. NIES-4074]
MPIQLKQLRKNLTYEISATIERIIADLQEITELDKLAEIKQKQYDKKAIYCFIGLLASLALTFVLPILIILVFVLVILFIYILVIRAKFSRINVENYRYEVTQKVLQMLDRDIDKASEVKLQLSFNSVDKNEYKTGTTPHPYKSGWKIDNYEHEWLNMQGQFLDKTRFQLTVNGLAKRQYGWKRSSSGKNKHKSKTKSRGLDISLILNYPQRRYGEVKALENALLDAVKLPNLADLKGAKVTNKTIHLVVRVGSQVADNTQEIYQTITMMFLSIYQVLNFAKKLAK